MFLEHDGLHVGPVHHHVDDGELGIRVFLRHLVQRRRLAKADRDDRVVAAAGEVAQGLPTLRLVGHLELAVADPGRYEVRVILDQDSVDTIAKLKGWLSHVNPGFTTGQLLAYLLQQACIRCQA